MQIHSPTFLRRLAANFYDALLVFGICCALTALCISIKVHFFAPVNMGEPALNTWQRHILQGVLALGIYSFYIYFWMRYGKTLGMQTWKLALINSTQKTHRINFKQANLRFFSALLSYAFLGLGVLWSLVDKERHTWHDRISKTHLIYTKAS